MKLPEVSVIVTCYNYGFWLPRCIRSLLNQKGMDIDNYEIIIVDDGSEDNSLQIAQSYEQKFSNIRVLSNQFNRGLPFSCNKAIEESIGRYIVRVDADDYVAREFLFIGSWFMTKNCQYKAAACDYLLIDEDEIPMRRVNPFKEEIACGVFFRREYIYEIGLYDIGFKLREGHDLMQRFKGKYLIGRIEFPLYKYQQHPNNRTKVLKDEAEEYSKELKKGDKE